LFPAQIDTSCHPYFKKCSTIMGCQGSKTAKAPASVEEKQSTSPTLLKDPAADGKAVKNEEAPAVEGAAAKTDTENQATDGAAPTAEVGQAKTDAENAAPDGAAPTADVAEAASKVEESKVESAVPTEAANTTAPEVEEGKVADAAPTGDHGVTATEEVAQVAATTEEVAAATEEVAAPSTEAKGNMADLQQVIAPEDGGELKEVVAAEPVAEEPKAMSTPASWNCCAAYA